MKLHFAILLLLFSFSFKVNAQPKAGDFLLGGGFSANSTKYNSIQEYTNTLTKAFQGTFTPQIGYFITKNIVVSGFINIAYQRRTEEVYLNGILIDTFHNSTNKTLSISVGSIVEYFHPIKEKLFWVNSFSYEKGYTADGFGVSSIFVKNKSVVNRIGFTQCNINTGIKYFFKNNVCLTLNTTVFSINRKDKILTANFLNQQKLISIGFNYLIISDED